MSILSHRTFICFLALNLSLCLIVQSGLIDRPTLSNEELLALMENNDYINQNRNDGYRASFYQPSLFDDFTNRQIINSHLNAKRSKLNLHTNLNLPRYLRTVD